MTTEDETKAMSRLLTRGAKMLQQGCEDCGNPLFRYQGEVVCPVCRERQNGEQGGERQTGDEKSAEEEAVDESLSQGNSETSEGVGEESDWQGETAVELRKLARRLSSEAAEEEDLSRVQDLLKTLRKTVELLENLEGEEEEGERK